MRESVQDVVWHKACARTLKYVGNYTADTKFEIGSLRDC